jgi:FHA domain
MTSTGLLAAQAAILVLLFGVVVLIVRSSARQIRTAAPPPLALDDPVEPRLAPQAPPVVRMAEPAPIPPAPPPEPAAVAIAVGAALPDLNPNRDNAEPEVDSMGRSDRQSFDFDANLQPRLVVEAGPGLTVGTVFPLESGLSIGRADANDLAVDDAFMSHMHARILRRGPFFYVEDLGSTNGTFVNEQRITGDAHLRVRDELRLGETVLRYEE